MVKRLRWFGLVLLVSAASFAGTASADQWAGGNVYDDGNQCVGNTTILLRTHNSVQTTSTTNSHFYFPTIACHYSNPRPNGYIAGRWESMKWGPNAGAWLMCGTQGFEYGGGTTFTVGRTTTGCGSGYYFLWGGSFVYNGGWKGGWVNTAYEWFNY
jgi:hypothetical protein